MVRAIIYVLNAVFVFLTAWFVSRFLRQFVKGGKPRGRRANPFRTERPSEVHGEAARDPVCGMFVSTELSHRLEIGGRTLHFCSDECLQKYQSKVSSPQSPDKVAKS